MTDYNRENEQYTSGNNNQTYDDIYSSQPEQQPVTQSVEPTAQPETAYTANSQSNTYSSHPVYPSNNEIYPQHQEQSYYAQSQQPAQYNEPYNQYQVQQPSHMYDASYYQSQQQNTTNNSDVPPSPKKKSKTAKHVAIIAACLALVACVGVGGGFLGTMIAKDSALATSTENGKSSSETSNETSKGSLTINKSDGTQVAATTTQEVVERAANSVVEITTESVVNGQFMQQYVSKGAGSGVIISEDGYIITNNHVINGAKTITVTLANGKTYKATLIGSDSKVDVALIKIDETGLTPVTFGDSDNLKVGETAIAIGNPLGKLGGTVTNGIISALDREITIDDETMNLLQTNAAINPGNSGGGLFNANAELIGLVVAKSSGENIEGLGFAIPINDVVNILQDLMDHGHVTGRPSLGVSLADISEEQLFSYRLDEAGTYITNIASNSAADKAGLEIGDRLIKIGDTEITSASQASNEVNKHKAGDEISITVNRDGENVTVNVKLDEESQASEDLESNTLTDPYQYYYNNGMY